MNPDYLNSAMLNLKKITCTPNTDSSCLHYLLFNSNDDGLSMSKAFTSEEGTFITEVYNKQNKYFMYTCSKISAKSLVSFGGNTSK